jgi:hypothetical protein
MIQQQITYSPYSEKNRFLMIDYLQQEKAKVPNEVLDNYPSLLAQKANGEIVGVAYSRELSDGIIEMFAYGDSAEIIMKLKKNLRKLIPTAMWPIAIEA